jgi:hypothetical protein
MIIPIKDGFKTRWSEIPNLEKHLLLFILSSSATLSILISRRPFSPKFLYYNIINPIKFKTIAEKSRFICKTLKIEGKFRSLLITEPQNGMKLFNT